MTELDWQTKGAPVCPPGTELHDLADGRTEIFGAGFLFPLMLLRESALAHNLATMADFCRTAGVELAPHGKTHMCPALADRQLAAGAWGMTVATISQARVYRGFGVSRLFLANELVDPAAIAWVGEQVAAGLEFVGYVDSVAGVELLRRHLPPGPPVDVVIELGPAGARTGVRSVAEAVAVGRAVADTDRLRLRGVSAYEGGFGSGPDAPDAAVQQQVREFLGQLRAAGEAIAPWVPAELPLLASAGGSVYFDLVAEELTRGWTFDRPVTAVLRSGCYVAHDQGSYRHKTPFGRTLPGTLRPAVEVWASVLSCPEPGLALAGAGRRDVSFDIDLPTVQGIRTLDGRQKPAAGITVTALNDQHAYLQLPAAVDLRVGDLVQLGVSHPCTTFDKWRAIPVVDDDYRVLDYVHTYF